MPGPCLLGARARRLKTAVWQRGYLEWSSTGLYVLSLEAGGEGRQHLLTAEALCDADSGPVKLVSRVPPQPTDQHQLRMHDRHQPTAPADPAEADLTDRIDDVAAPRAADRPENGRGTVTPRR